MSNTDTSEVKRCRQTLFIFQEMVFHRLHEWRDSGALHHFVLLEFVKTLGEEK